MNKKIGLLLGGLILSALVFNLVSAYSSGSFDFRSGSEQLINIVTDFSEPFISIFLGGETTGYTGYLLFEKLLLFLLLLSITYLSLNKTPFFKDQKGVIWVVSLAVPLLSIRLLDFMWLQTIFLQYKILGIALTSILPFLIYLFFLHGVSESGAVRKIGWIFFIVIYYFLWSTTSENGYAEIYFWTMFLSFVFLFLDGTIHSYFATEKIKEARSTKVLEHMGELNKKLIEVDSLPGLTDDQKRKMKKDYITKIANYQKLL